MPAISSSAPGKIILFGEHSVVYGYPAIAIPVSQVQARAVVFARPNANWGEVEIDAPDIGLHEFLTNLPSDHPLRIAIQQTQAMLGLAHLPAFLIKVTSSIPVAAGLGSGAAVSVAIIRAVSGFLGQKLSLEQVSAAAFQVEKRHHGTPSGIDNTVVTYQKPIVFTTGQPFEVLNPGNDLVFIIADSGIHSPTVNVVSDLRARRQTDPARFDHLFSDIAALVIQARQAIITGDTETLGSLMDANHQILKELDVSCLELDQLVIAARSAGAAGAKLSGAGRGGNMIALVRPDQIENVSNAFRAAGAVRIITTELKKTEPA
jgi:mevalonate kinase